MLVDHDDFCHSLVFWGRYSKKHLVFPLHLNQHDMKKQAVYTHSSISCQEYMIQASEGNTSAVKTRNLIFIISKSLLHCIKQARSETRGKTQLLWEISVNLNMCVHTKYQQMLMDSKQWIQSLWACRGYELSLLWQVLPFHQNIRI